MKRLSFLIAGCMCLCACGAQNIRPTSAPQLGADSAVLLLGMTPSWRIQLFTGDVEDDTWSVSGFRGPEVNTSPENGYVIAKVKPTAQSEAIGILRVFPGMMPYTLCHDTRAPTFALSAGVVNYVGDMDFEVTDGGLQYSYSTNVEKAKAFLAAHYPAYVNAFESHPMVALSAKGRGCSARIPIIIPVR